MPRAVKRRRLSRRTGPAKKSKYWDAAVGLGTAAYDTYKGYQKAKTVVANLKKYQKKKTSHKEIQTKKAKESEYISGSTRGECTVSTVTHRLKPSKLSHVHKALANKFKYETMTVEQVLHTDDQNTPRQQEETAFSILNGTDYGAIVNTYYQNLPDTHPMQGKYPESGTMTGGKGHKVLIEKCNYEIELQNCTQGMVMLDIYTLVAKTTGVYEDPVTATWTNAISSDGGTSLTTTGTRNFPGNKPTYYKQFRDTWKVLKKVTISMMGGSMHRHYVHWNVNRITDYDHWSKYTMSKGYTGAVILVARGQLGDNTLGMKGTQTVTYTPVKINYAIKQYSTCRIISTMPTNHYYNNAVGSITYDEDVNTDHVYIPDPDGNGVIDAHDTANIS